MVPSLQLVCTASFGGVVQIEYEVALGVDFEVSSFPELRTCQYKQLGRISKE